MRPVPPGEILNEEFLKPLGLTANALAKAIGVPPNRITAILKDERGITGDTAIRLGMFFKRCHLNGAFKRKRCQALIICLFRNIADKPKGVRQYQRSKA